MIATYFPPYLFTKHFRFLHFKFVFRVKINKFLFIKEFKYICINTDNAYEINIKISTETLIFITMREI